MTEPTQTSDRAAIASLAKSLKGIKIWLLVLTLVVAVAPLLLVGGCAVLFFGIASNADEDVGEVSGAQIASAEKDVRSAYGSDLESLNVRSITVKYDDVPFPFSLAAGEEDGLYVEYRLKGSKVTVADVASEPTRADVVMMGLLPTQGPLPYRLTRPQFDALLQEFGKHTRSPLGSVSKYGPKNAPEEFQEDGHGPKEITINERKYLTKELWSAAIGRKMTSDSIKMSELDGPKKALIFHLDPKTGAFVYLGTEPVEDWY